MSETTPKYRDSVFRHYFSEDKSRLLSLVNALLGTDASDPDEIEVNTLDGLFFNTVKNDISFLFRGRLLILIEHQSTLNENMPARFLLYFAELLKAYIADKDKFFRRRLIRLPRPEFFVIYNGRQAAPESSRMKLSDAFDGDGDTLELKVKFLNVTEGHNPDLISHSRHLADYCLFVERVERHRKTGWALKDALADAIDFCITHNVMSDYLKRHGKEVIGMYDYGITEEDARRIIREESYEEGFEEGRADGIEYGIERGTFDMIKRLMESMSWTAQQAMDALKIPPSDRAKYIRQL